MLLTRYTKSSSCINDGIYNSAGVIAKDTQIMQPACFKSYLINPYSYSYSASRVSFACKCSYCKVPFSVILWQKTSDTRFCSLLVLSHHLINSCSNSYNAVRGFVRMNVQLLFRGSVAKNHGTGSYPCPPQGWQRAILFAVSHSPFTGPYFFSASIP